MIELHQNPILRASRNQWLVYAMLTIFSFTLMLFCTKSSPLFAFNDWYDANVYFTMGKGLMNGRVPYVDLIDNKGPLLYLIYGISWMFDNTGFFGVYLFQSLFVAVSVIFAYKLALLFIKNAQIAFFVALCSPMPMLLNRFYAVGYDFGGGGPDEICRALMIAALFYFTLYYVKPEEYKPLHTLILGCLFMGAFLIKFNLTVFWAGFLLIIAFELIYKKKFAFLLRHIAAFVSGAAATVLPYLIYGAVTESLGAFVNTYFLYNWLYVNPSNNLVIKAVESLISAVGAIGSMWGISLLFSVGAVFVFFVCRTGFKVGYSLSLILLFTATYYTTIRFATIHIPFTVSLIFGMVALGVLVEKYLTKHRLPKLLIFMKPIAVISVMCVTIALNGLVTYELFLSDKQSVQQQMAEIIRKNTRSDSPTLLEINGLDSGFYTAAGIIPDEPYFFVYNVDHEVYPYPREAQKNAVTEGHSEFVIVGEAAGSMPINPYNIRQSYDEIYVLHGTGYQSNIVYYLFRRKLDFAKGGAE
ncbi:MAG: hypothetical protein PHR14_08545 [Oscillospiraceae bacterium]|nr:hypothetical protein [Oscillospiraceae bacterium]